MLITAKQKFISSLSNIYGDIKEPKTHPDYTSRECDAIHAFIITATPMTIISTLPGGVGGYTTAGPVSGNGIGGIDKKVAGMGLDAAKKILENDLKNAYSHGNTPHPSSIQAVKIATAIEKYMLQAIVRTKDITAGPRPAPASSGPVAGPIKGLGGIKTNKPGIGYKAAKPKFKQTMTSIYSRIEKEYSHAEKAKQIADAIHAFAIEGIVKTDGTFSAGAAVSSESGSGSYFAGTGQSIKATLS